MKFLLLIPIILIGFKSFGSQTSVQDSLQPFEKDIVAAFADDLPVIVIIDSVRYYYSNSVYDDYFRIMKGSMYPTNPIIENTYPRVEIVVSQYSQVKGKDQIRMLDIETMSVKRGPKKSHKLGERPCEDKIILKDGDTLDVRIFRISQDHVEYQKCSQKIKRVYGFEKYEIYKIIYANGNEDIFYTPEEDGQHRRRKKKYVGAAIGATIGLVIIGGMTAYLANYYFE